MRRDVKMFMRVSSSSPPSNLLAFRRVTRKYGLFDNEGSDDTGEVGIGLNANENDAKHAAPKSACNVILVGLIVSNLDL